MSLRRYSAGSQRRRRERTALARSLLSALDNQRTEGRAILILHASEPPRGMEPTATIPVNTTAARIKIYTTPYRTIDHIGFVQLDSNMFSSPIFLFYVPASGECGLIYTKLAQRVLMH